MLKLFSSTIAYSVIFERLVTAAAKMNSRNVTALFMSLFEGAARGE